MAEAFASSVASKLGECLFAPIGRQFGYVLHYMSYVEDLKNEVEKLEAARERVQHSVDEALYDGKPIHTDIKNWLENVENKAKDARDLLKHGGSAKNACFRGWLPNPMVRHPIGKKVKKMTQVIRELHNESENNNFQKVYYENPPIGIVVATTSAARSVDKKEDVLESRASITEDVMKAIIDDKICVVGVYGPGGVGKSKLLEDIQKQVKKEKQFDVVATANVSRNPDLKTIQGEIADALGLKLMNVETARGRADRLRERLECDREKKILIILDNLWKKLELKDVGIPCGDGNKVRGCKLLLSSRNREVLRIDMVSDQEFRLKELDDGEARRLFERILGNIIYDPEIRPLVDGVVKNCGGFPLFIISLAKRLRSGNLAAWRNALTIAGSDLKSLVELNYKNLKDERIQSLFLVCALSHGWEEVDILVYGLGLGLFNNFSKTIGDARDRLNMDLDCLCNSSLLLDSDNSSKKI
ncbi:probable disease resistance protein At5g63020 [Eucalyptus grandis]|uniref:probable disease resistance protein At5g63020 n=1 Tax=Eucalyptus grandis TaxID=71139 RepID=UPI00192F0FBE|nr:probable disease resistance protein At5g63020 [Eucalyptus grandis]